LSTKESTSPTFPTYHPHLPEASSYILPRVERSRRTDEIVPPKETWISRKYGASADEYLASGKRDLEEMLSICNRAGVLVEALGHILEFGCADGRMIRWLRHLAHDREVWGTDIDAERIYWCKQNLGPPLHFITNTMVPHLPFEDRHFGFIYAGSVFTHIDDLADAWLAELRRILRPGGKLFITVHLKNDIELLKNKHRDSGLARLLHSRPEYEEFMATDFDMFTVGRSSQSYVFYDIAYLRENLEPLFRILSVTAEVRLYQNALLLERA
jgi:SAM-dependent methyltransferase